MPHGLDQQFLQMLDIDFGDAVAALGLVARMFGGHEPDPRGEARRPVESQEPGGLARDRGCRYGVDALQSPQCVAYRLSPGVSLSPGLRL